MPAIDTTSKHTDPKLLHPLDQLRGTIRRFVLWDGLLAGFMVLVVAFWLGLLVDYGLFRATGFDLVQEIPAFFRGAALAFWVILFLAVIVTRVFLRFSREFSYPVLALVLESRFPKLLGDRLINAVELSDPAKAKRYGYSTEMINKTIEEARERVGQLPVRSIFNWSRLWLKLLVLLVISLGLLAATFLSYGLLSGKFEVADFSWRFGDIVSIWSERHLMLKNTPWPRKAYVELVGFPDGPKGLRIGTNARAPRISAKAYQWVVVEPGSYHGWRPMLWKDITPELLGEAVPDQVRLTEDGPWASGDNARAALSGSLSFFNRKLPEAVKVIQLQDLTVDQVGFDYLQASPELAKVFLKLTELSEQPRLSRKLRKLERPDKLLLTYNGKPSESGRSQGSTRGQVDLAPDSTGEFSGEVINLKESVSFRVRAGDFRTDSKDIVLVPPPKLNRLQLQQSQPAYLYHPAPEESSAPAGSPFLLLKGLRQQLAPVELTLTGEKSVTSVPVGTDLTIQAQSDKPLQAVRVTVQKGRVPGQPIKGSNQLDIPFEDSGFKLEFTGVWQLRETAEFDLQLIDEDGVSSSRSILIQAQEDKAPQVDLAVDVLRKVGATYFCTPRARIPFIKESGTDDSTPLSKLDFEYTVIRQESAIVTAIQVKALPSIFNTVPVLNPWGSVFSSAVGVNALKRIGQGEQRQFGTIESRPFERQYSLLQKDTLETLKKKLAEPVTDPDPRKRNVVREVKFKLEEDVLDLELVDKQLAKTGAAMAVTSASDLQPRFRVELNLVATDANYESGPKQGRILQPILLMVMSEADLLAEISKDEEAAIARLDEALRKLRDSQVKLQQQIDRLVPTTPAPDVLVSARVRAEDIVQDLAKARDLTQVALAEYTRLKREVDYNRCNAAVSRKYENDIIKPLTDVLAQEFQTTEDALQAFRNPLVDGQRPDDSVQNSAKSNLTTLIYKLNQIRERLGQSLTENQLRDSIRLISERQKELSDTYQRIRQRVIGELFAPKLQPIPAITLNKKEQRRITQLIEWGVFDKDELKLRIEAPAGSGLRTPGDLTIKTDKDDYQFDIQAGENVGTFEVKITPAIGSPIVVKVTVK
jgi:hypothetical protein